MTKIELTAYEYKDLLDILEYAKLCYMYELDKKRLPKYWINRIEQLKKVIKGNEYNSYTKE